MYYVDASVFFQSKEIIFYRDRFYLLYFCLCLQQQQQQQQQQQDIVELEAGPIARPPRRRKTSQNDHSHGSFFLRIGAIGKTVFNYYKLYH